MRYSVQYHDDYYQIGEWTAVEYPPRLLPEQIAWCIERGIFKRDMLADHFVETNKKVQP